jgi:hypothetical protein
MAEQPALPLTRHCLRCDDPHPGVGCHYDFDLCRSCDAAESWFRHRDPIPDDRTALDQHVAEYLANETQSELCSDSWLVADDG